MKRSLPLFFLAILFAFPLISQITITGTVRNVGGETLPGVNVLEKGTSNGAFSDFDGRYEMEVLPGNILLFSMVGFETKEIPAPADGKLDVILEEGIELKEVVVTALGVKREVASLSYSTTKISAEPFTVGRETNVANALTGRVAGVNVSSTSSGPGGSAKVIIRGLHSISRDNQPLYVVDGLPIDNTNLGNFTGEGAFDLGDGIGSINPDDIESVQVLRGANAAALYGSRAVNGVILMITKQGAAGKFGVEFNSNFTLEQPLVFHDWQREYGQGWVAFKPSSQGDALSSNWFHFGPKLDGLPTIQFDGVERPYADAGDAFKAFYQSGQTFTNSLALTGGAEKINFRFGLTNMENRSIIPNSGLSRRNFTLALNAQPVRGLSATFNVRYINENVDNRSRLSSSPLNVNYAIGVLPVNTPLEALRGPNGDGSTADGKELSFSGNPYISNPFWTIYRARNNDVKNRFIGSGELKYDWNNWVYALLRVGRDQYTSRRTNLIPVGTAFQLKGGLTETNIESKATTIDSWIGSHHRFDNGLGYDILAGVSRTDENAEILSVGGTDFLIPSLQTISNLANVTNYYALWRQRTNAIFSTLQLSWKSLLYLNLTGRQEWFSTLPKASNDLFFPSAGLSFVFTELPHIPSWLAFGKWRFSYAQVSGDVDPYSLNLYYNLRGSDHLGLPVGQVTNTTVPDAALHPALADELETGFDLRFLQGRLGLDISGYRQHTRKDLVVSAISITSGFEARFVKDGEITNLGIEALVYATPFKRDKWTWETSVNLAANRNRVISLGDASSIQLAKSDNSTPVAFLHNEVGHPASVIKGFAYQRDANGNIIIGADGVPLQGDLKVMGNGVPNFTGGWNNTLRWGNFSLNFLIDFKAGAKMFSGTNAFATLTGRHKSTLEGREDGYVSPGVTVSGEPNTVVINPLYAIAYWSVLPGRIAEPYIYDASFAKLRQASLTWFVPAQKVFGVSVKELQLSVTGRNLLLLFSKVPNVDPESTFQTGNAQGLEQFSVPSVRTYGFDVRFKF